MIKTIVNLNDYRNTNEYGCKKTIITSPKNYIIAEKFRTVRMLLSYSQQQISETLSRSVSMISYYENAHKSIPMDILVNLSNLANLKLEFFTDNSIKPNQIQFYIKPTTLSDPVYSWLQGNYNIYIFENDQCKQGSLNIYSNEQATLEIDSIQYFGKITFNPKVLSICFQSSIDILNILLAIPNLRHSYIGGLINCQKLSSGKLKQPINISAFISKASFTDPTETFNTIINNPLISDCDEQVYHAVKNRLIDHLIQNKYFFYTADITRELSIDESCFLKLRKCIRKSIA